MFIEVGLSVGKLWMFALFCADVTYHSLVLCRVINGLKAQKTPMKDARIVFYGAGSSAVGVATMIASLLQTEAGLSPEDALKVLPYDIQDSVCWKANFEEPSFQGSMHILCNFNLLV